jgi:transcriptional regulator with XRE-family HTH domain
MTTTNKRTLFGENIHRIRKRKNMTLKTLSEKTNKSIPYLWQLENRAENPTLKTLETIADVLEIPIYYLFLKETDDIPFVEELKIYLKKIELRNYELQDVTSHIDYHIGHMYYLINKNQNDA